MSRVKISSVRSVAVLFGLVLLHFAACRNQEGAPEAPGYRVAVVEQGSGELSLFDPQNGDILGAVKIGYNPHEIAVTRDGHKKIVLGAGGQTIKAIGAESRRELMEIFEVPVHLFLFVKVREKWGDDPERYREMGLEYPQGK